MGLERTVNTEETVWGACYHMKAIILICCLLSISQVQAKNVVLFLGDGMGITTITAARIYEGQLQGKAAKKTLAELRKFSKRCVHKTYSGCPNSRFSGNYERYYERRKDPAGVLGVGPKYARVIATQY